jgi:putative endonuclease
MRHFVYMLRCADDSLYTGYTTDLKRRVAEHNGKGPGTGARATRGKRPVELVFHKYFMSRSKAMSYEAHIKQLTRAEKLKFVTTNNKK